MKQKGLVVLSALACSLILTGCGHSGDSSAASQASGQTTSTKSGDSGSASQTSTSGSGESESYEDVVWAGKVKIYYHDDSGSYANHCLWLWADGYAPNVETGFDNIATPDGYGVYYVLDLSAAPWNKLQLLSIKFIYKVIGTWSDQSTDTEIRFGKFVSNKTTDGDGKEMITIYAAGQGNGDIATYAKKDDALGDHMGAAYFSDWRTITCTGTGTADSSRTSSDLGLCSSYTLYAFDGLYYAMTTAQKAEKKNNYAILTGTPNSNAWTISLDKDATPSLVYVVEGVFAHNPSSPKQKAANFISLYDNATFISKYTYDGTDLGCNYDASTQKYTFKLWAPTAARVTLNLYSKTAGTPRSLLQNVDLTTVIDVATEKDMVLGSQGVYSYSDALVNTRSDGSTYSPYAYYTYTVYNSEGSAETIDPYAKSSGINGVRGYITSPDKLAAETDPSGFRTSIASLPAISSPNQLSVYEVHVRDFTADSSWKSNDSTWDATSAVYSYKAKNGTYAAFYEEGTTYASGSSSVKTGFDSLKELGVNAVQLLPVFDQANDERTIVAKGENTTTYTYPEYNWGYNPQNYDCVEGAYASDPSSPTAKVKEYKELIKACADNKMRVIMDVVYNHMAAVGDNAFNKVMPKYYFKTDATTGAYVDETGVHNTFNTARKMGSNYVVDSCKWWASQYGVKGFRFDLMGAIETSTIKAVKEALYDIDPQIVVYGEGWRGSGSSTSSQAGTYNVYANLSDCDGKGSVGCFNDAGRDGLKGNTTYGSVAPSYGFMSQTGDFSSNTLYNGACTYLGENRNITGSGMATRPAQTVNYVSCHDNYTLYDQLNYCRAGGAEADIDHADIMQSSVATSAFVLMSQGIAFIQGGEEIFRQKVMKSDDKYWDKIAADDYVALSDGNRLVRNSYAYGDAVNSFKWDRKLTYKSYFDQYAAASNERNTLVKEGYLGVSYDKIQGTYGSGTKVSRLWDDIWDAIASPHRSVIAAQTEFSKAGSSLKDFYVILGGRMSGSSQTLGIGSGTCEVLYDSTSSLTTGSTLTISGNAMNVQGYQCLVLRRLS